MNCPHLRKQEPIMKLTPILETINYEVLQGTIDREITAVIYDSRKVTEGCLFLCIKGTNFDGHQFAAEAVG